jgi:hypothetical protein
MTELKKFFTVTATSFFEKRVISNQQLIDRILRDQLTSAVRGSGVPRLVEKPPPPGCCQPAAPTGQRTRLLEEWASVGKTPAQQPDSLQQHASEKI